MSDLKIYGYSINYSLEKELKKFISWYQEYILDTNLACNEYYESIDNLLEFISKFSGYILSVGNANDFELFYKLVDEKEVEILKKPSLKGKYYLNDKVITYDFLNKKITNDYIVLTNDGLIKSSSLKRIVGKKIDELGDKDVSKYDLLKFNKMVGEYNLKNDLIDYLLTIVLYCLIDYEKENCAHLALDYAIAFKRDIDIPVTYGINLNDPNLISFINKYLNAGGNEDIMCFYNYQKRKNNFAPLAYTKLRCIIEYSKEKEVLR